MPKKAEKSDLRPLPPIPSHLSARSQALWRELVPSRCRSAGRVALLEQCLTALDRAEVARQIVEREGFTKTTESTGAVHIHPVVKAEREARAQFLRAAEILGLSWDALVDGRTNWPAQSYPKGE